MRTEVLLVLIALAGTVLYTMQPEIATPNLRPELYKEYVQWKSVNGVNTNAEQDEYRFNVWSQNYKFVEKFNAEQTGSLRLGMTPFADLTLEEYSEKYLSKLGGSTSEFEAREIKSTKAVPTSVNWTAKGAVTPVENQGQCGSCWAFSTKAGLEGAYQLSSGNLVTLSAQQLVDCSTLNFGCSGGDPMTAYRYTQAKGIESEASYPYTSGTTTKRGTCQYDQSKVVFTNKGQVKVAPTENVEAIQQAAANQPLTIEVSAGNVAFQLYKSGVLNSKMCGDTLDHGVTLTGYNNGASEPYWTIKNSWGTGWGQSGYANIAITGNGKGMCGIQQYAAYPTW